MIDFIRRWLDNQKEQKRILNESCDQFVSKIESLCAENSMLFQPLTEFVEPNKGVALATVFIVVFVVGAKQMVY